ncbi:MAG TPA: glutaredoxin family protein [Solirubrobacterales bacterium]|jgi:glutaredoxin|nr:glutaredoxin family protein [Solirubrobacterales bacterium]
MPSRPSVVLYARPDCHLCDEARDGLERLRADGLDFDLNEIDIEADDELHRRFLERIPVVELDGEFVSELFLDADGLRARLDTLSA